MKKLFNIAMHIAKTYDVTTPKDKLVLYSVSFLPSKINRELAYSFILQYPQFVSLDHTPCGRKLIELKLNRSEGGLTPNEITQIWDIASERLIQNASGSVKAFVEGANPQSTFCRIELPNLLNNTEITMINDEDKYIFASRILS